MRQRGAIARAFVTDPEILLMDEPFAALDEQNRSSCRRAAAALGETGKTVVYVTHSLDEALLTVRSPSSSASSIECVTKTMVLRDSAQIRSSSSCRVRRV